MEAVTVNRSTTDQQIRDSEENIINSTYWHIMPFFRMIRNGETKKLMGSLDIEIDRFDFHKRIPKDKRKEIEYMIVSLINTFMIAAIMGGVYPPDANWIADKALAMIAAVKDARELTPILKDAAYDFCEKVRLFRLADTGNPHVEKVRRYIRTHLSQNITIDDICAEVNVSRYHLSRIFKASTGETINHYLVNERIKAAEDLLKNSEQSVSAIASLLQFCDESYFIATFKKYAGMTPGEYRKKRETFEL